MLIVSATNVAIVFFICVYSFLYIAKLIPKQQYILSLFADILTIFADYAHNQWFANVNRHHKRREIK